MKLTIKKLKDFGFRPIDIAVICKVSQPAIFKWEKSNRIPDRHMKKLVSMVQRRFKKLGNFVNKL